MPSLETPPHSIGLKFRGHSNCFRLVDPQSFMEKKFPDLIKKYSAGHFDLNFFQLCISPSCDEKISAKPRKVQKNSRLGTNFSISISDGSGHLSKKFVVRRPTTRSFKMISPSLEPSLTKVWRHFPSPAAGLDRCCSKSSH